MPVYKVLSSWYRYARKLATCYYTRSPYCCCVATIVHTGDQLPDPRLVSRALISREARVSHFAPRETTNSYDSSTKRVASAALHFAFCVVPLKP